MFKRLAILAFMAVSLASAKTYTSILATMRRSALRN